MNVGEVISNRRKELGLTLEEVGDAVGVGKSTVSKWESGYISNMRRDKIALLAKTLQISPTVLIDEEESVGENINGKRSCVLSLRELELITEYRSLNDEGQEKVRDYISDIVLGGRYKKDTAHGMVQEA